MRKTHVQEVHCPCGNAQICPGGIEAEWRHLAKQAWGHQGRPPGREGDFTDPPEFTP